MNGTLFFEGGHLDTNFASENGGAMFVDVCISQNILIFSSHLASSHLISLDLISTHFIILFNLTG